jgi:hypothetical protein
LRRSLIYPGKPAWTKPHARIELATIPRARRKGADVARSEPLTMNIAAIQKSQ